MTRSRAEAPRPPSVERCRAALADGLLAAPENGHLRAMLADPERRWALHGALLRASHRLCFLDRCAQAGLQPPAELGPPQAWRAAPWAELIGALAAIGAPEEIGAQLGPLEDATLRGPALAAVWATLDENDDPHDLSAAYEGQLALEPVDEGGRLALRPSEDSARSRQGSFYTPAGLVEATLDLALGDAALPAAPRVLDPACGAGHFLLAVAARLGAGLPPADRLHLVENTIYGVDLDPIAVELCRLRLYLWAGCSGAALAPLHRQIAVGEALLGWSWSAPEGPPPPSAWAKLPGEDPTIGRRLRRDALIGALGAPPDAGTRAAADRWCAAFFWPRGTAGAAAEAPTPDRWGTPPSPAALAIAAEIGVERTFLHWGQRFPEVAGAGGFDLIVGNPPFLSPLSAKSALAPEAARLIDATLPDRRTATTDLATLFLARSAQLLGRSGRLGLVLPLATLSAEGGAPTRAALAREGGLDGLWITEQRSFADANVRVCVLGYQRGGPRRLNLRRRVGPDFAAAAPRPIDMDLLAASPEGWGPLAADLAGAPPVIVESSGDIADLAEATGDFRDQFYGLAPFVREARDDEAPSAALPRLIITGLIDPAADLWGQRPCRFAGLRYARPVVERAALLADPTLGAWAAARLRPKLMVATQSKVIEAAADPAGDALNTVPTLTVLPKDPADLWRLLAVLLAPPLSALAWSQTFGAALSAQAIKLSASQLLRLPLPAHALPWAAGAAAARSANEATDEPTRRAALLRCGAAMCAAYGLPAEPTLGWWAARLPG